MNETMLEQGAQFHTIETAHPFLWAGNSTFTLVSKATHKRFTYKLRAVDDTKVNSVYFVSVLSGPDNDASYSYMGLVDIEAHTFKLTRNSKVTDKAASYIAFKWFVDTLFSNPESLFAQAEIWHEGKCGRCGRKLTVPSSIEAGIGPECMSKMGGE